MRGRVLALSIALAACSSTDNEPAPGGPPPPDAGPAPEAAGLLPWVCQPGEVLADDGSCDPAGIPPDGCGKGFAHDGLDGCDPILPSSPCGPGLLALPGETTCRPVAPCAAGKWGDIAIDASTVHVDASHTGPSDGSAQSPYTTIAEAITAADPGATIAIAAGVYPEALTLFKPVVLWGTCPADVEIAAPAGDIVISIGPAADGTVVRSLAVTGGNGIVTFAAQDVLIDRAWVHDTAGEGISAAKNGPVQPHVAIEGSLVESVHGFGVRGYGAHVVVSRSVIRDVDTDPSGMLGIGIEGSSGGLTEVSSLRIEESIIERVHLGGVEAWSIPVDIVDSVVRDVEEAASASVDSAPCITALVAEGAPPPHVSITTSVLERCTRFGVFASDGEVTMERTMVRDVTPSPSSGGLYLGDGPVTCDLSHSVVSGFPGIGVVFRGASCNMVGLVVRNVTTFGDGSFLAGGITVEQSGLPLGPEAAIRGARIEDTGHRGIVVRGAKATIDTTLVTRVSNLEGFVAAGVIVEPNRDASSGPLVASTCTLRDSSIEHVLGLGIAVVQSDAQIHSTRVADLTDSADGSLSTGISVLAPEVGLPSSVTITHCLVERAQVLGLVVSGLSSTTLDHTIIRETTPDPTLGLGDCISMFTLSDLGRTSLTITGSVLQSAARAGISNFGGDAAISTTRFECNPIDLDGEQFNVANLNGDLAAVPSEYAFDDRGGNTCGCGKESWPCQVKTEHLVPPIPPGVPQ